MLTLLLAMEEGALRQRAELPTPARCEELLAGMARGDGGAFEAFYRATDRTLYAYALSLTRNHHDAQDVMMETYLRLRQGARGYRSQGKPMAWVFAVTRNVAMSQLRAAGREQSWGIVPEEAIPPLEEESLERLVLKAALEDLEEAEREIVLLHAVSGLHHREIGAVLGLPLGTVLSKYTRALGKLRKRLEEKEV